MRDAEISDQVPGASHVIAHYGHWPSFHDADLVKIDIEMTGPTVVIEFRLYDWNEAAGRAKRPRLVMTWERVDRINFTGIDELGQNSVSSFRLSQSTDEKARWIETAISSTGTGTDAQLRAAKVKVICFEEDEDWQHESIESWKNAKSGQLTDV